MPACMCKKYLHKCGRCSRQQQWINAEDEEAGS